MKGGDATAHTTAPAAASAAAANGDKFATSSRGLGALSTRRQGSAGRATPLATDYEEGETSTTATIRSASRADKKKRARQAGGAGSDSEESRYDEEAEEEDRQERNEGDEQTASESEDEGEADQRADETATVGASQQCANFKLAPSDDKTIRQALQKAARDFPDDVVSWWSAAHVYVGPRLFRTFLTVCDDTLAYLRSVHELLMHHRSPKPLLLRQTVWDAITYDREEERSKNVLSAKQEKFVSSKIKYSLFSVEPLVVASLVSTMDFGHARCIQRLSKRGTWQAVKASHMSCVSAAVRDIIGAQLERDCWRCICLLTLCPTDALALLVHRDMLEFLVLTIVDDSLVSRSFFLAKWSTVKDTRCLSVFSEEGEYHGASNFAEASVSQFIRYVYSNRISKRLTIEEEMMMWDSTRPGHGLSGSSDEELMERKATKRRRSMPPPAPPPGTPPASKRTKTVAQSRISTSLSLLATMVAQHRAATAAEGSAPVQGPSNAMMGPSTPNTAASLKSLAASSTAAHLSQGTGLATATSSLGGLDTSTSSLEAVLFDRVAKMA